MTPLKHADMARRNERADADAGDGEADLSSYLSETIDIEGGYIVIDGVTIPTEGWQVKFMDRDKGRMIVDGPAPERVVPGQQDREPIHAQPQAGAATADQAAAADEEEQEEEEELAPCASCHHDIPTDVQRCPNCGNWPRCEGLIFNVLATGAFLLFGLLFPPIWLLALFTVLASISYLVQKERYTATKKEHSLL